LAGGDNGQMGLNHSGQTKLSGKFHHHFDAGDSLTIETSGGGGFRSIV
jgi:N-methylhydantoinase B/oxoprolinase/acetone carboxylase alpha subunit